MRVHTWVNSVRVELEGTDDEVIRFLKRLASGEMDTRSNSTQVVPRPGSGSFPLSVPAPARTEP